MSVRQAQQEIDSAEFTAWIAFYHIQPFGPERDDIRSALLGFQLARNMHRDTRPRRLRLDDFKPTFSPTPQQIPEQTPAQMYAVLFNMTRAVGGRING